VAGRLAGGGAADAAVVSRGPGGGAGSLSAIAAESTQAFMSESTVGRTVSRAAGLAATADGAAARVGGRVTLAVNWAAAGAPAAAEATVMHAVRTSERCSEHVIPRQGARRVPTPRRGPRPRYSAFGAGFGQALTIASPIRAIVTCGSLSITHRWSALSFVSTQATTRDCR